MRTVRRLLAAAAPAATELDPPAAPAAAIPTLLLALFLVVLAFFIVMVSYATVDGDRSDRVMRSLTATFQGLRAADALPRPAGSAEGDALALRALEADLGTVFATRLGLDKVEIAVVGRALELAVTEDVLFHRGGTRLREAQLGVLDAIVTGVSKRLAGRPYTVTLRVAASDAGDRSPESSAPADLGLHRAALSLGRAAMTARALVTRGLPAPAVAVAVDPAAPDDQPSSRARIHAIVFVIRITHDGAAHAEAGGANAWRGPDGMDLNERRMPNP